MTHSNLPDPEKRKCERYDKSLKVCYEFPYRFPHRSTAKIKYQLKGQNKPKQFAGVSKNISATGLCLTSHYKLEKGQLLRLAITPPKGDKPIHMEGEVRWCARTGINAKKKNLFSSGILLQTVEGRSVEKSLPFRQDAQCHLEQRPWFDLLDFPQASAGTIGTLRL